MLRDNGFFYRPNVAIKNELLLACGNYYECTGDIQTHFIHVVLTDSMEWKNYINFSDYLNKNIDVAKDYEKLKVSLAKDAPVDNGREKYLKGKHKFIVYTLRKALVWSYLGKDVKIKIDRPIGSRYPKHANVVYLINYGYIPNVIGGDGEALDVYLLGVDIPVSEYFCRVVGIVHRKNDVEDKLVAAPFNMNFTLEEIANMIAFQEKCTHYESLLLAYKMPQDADILITHDSMFTESQYDKAHEGMVGITYYVMKNRIKYHIHGHIHKSYKKQYSNNVIEKSVYGCEYIDFEVIDEVEIRRFADSDAEGISKLIGRNFIEINSKDYPHEEMIDKAKSFRLIKSGAVQKVDTCMLFLMKM